jgi:hypothetical protein
VVTNVSEEGIVSVFRVTIRRHNPENRDGHFHSRENLKSRKVQQFFFPITTVGERVHRCFKS